MYLSIDIGGTKTLLALFTSHGLCLKRFKFPTDHDPIAYSNLLSKKLANFIPNQPIRHRIHAITVAIPGIVKHESNSYSFQLGNLDWPNIDLITPIKNLFNCKIFFVNDADLATLYEANRPNRKTGKTIYLTFSTGIGGGMAKDGHLLKASETFEPGHAKYEYKNRSLEWEDIAAAKAIVTDYHCSSLQDLNLNDDAILSDLINRISFGILDIIKQERPNTIIFGGPIGLIFDTIKQPLVDKIQSELNLTDVPNLQKAHRPTESVIYGAYLYSKQNYRE